MCSCKSANNPNGWNKAILLTPFWKSKKPFISIDACIAPIIKILWEHKIETGSCCCGHNKKIPSIVIGENEDGKVVYNLITKHFNKKINIYQWQIKLI